MNEETQEQTTNNDAAINLNAFRGRETREIKFRTPDGSKTIIGLVPTIVMVQQFIRTIVLDSMSKATEGILKQAFPGALKAPFEELVEEFPFLEASIAKVVLDWVGAAEEFCSIEEGRRSVMHSESGRVIAWRKPLREELKAMERGVLSGSRDSTSPMRAIKKLLTTIVEDPDEDFAAWLNEQPGRFIPLFGAISAFEKGLCEIAGN